VKLHVRLEGLEEPLIVSVLSDRDGRVETLVDGVPVHFELAEPLSGDYLVSQTGKLQRIQVLGSGASLEMLHGEGVSPATVMDERDTWLGSGAGADEQAAITVAMPGRVIAVDVEVGQEVARGDRLLVVEAMKMENDIRSPRDGRVTALNVGPGDSVKAGQRLVELEAL
jgi:biotin carboxyl carrier protein